MDWCIAIKGVDMAQGLLYIPCVQGPEFNIRIIEVQQAVYIHIPSYPISILMSTPSRYGGSINV